MSDDVRTGTKLVAIVSHDLRLAGQISSFLNERDGHARVVSTRDAARGQGLSSIDVLIIDEGWRGHAGCVSRLSRSGVRPFVLLLTRPDLVDAPSTDTWARVERPPASLVDATLAVPFRGRALSAILARLGVIRDSRPNPPVMGPHAASPAGGLIAPQRTTAELAEAGLPSPGLDRVAVAQRELAVPRRRGEGRAVHTSDEFGRVVTEANKTAGAPVFDTDFSRWGHLEETPIAAVLSKILAARLTGALDIGPTADNRRIYFLRGEPIGATTAAVDERIGPVLVKLGYATLSDLRLGEKRPDGELVGQRLIREGVITATELLEALDRQVQLRVLSCFAVQRGPYGFREGRSWIDGVVPRPQNPLVLLVEGIRRQVGPNQIASQLADNVGDIVRRTERFHAYAPYFVDEPQLAPLVALLDGERTLSAALAADPVLASDTLTLVFAFTQAKLFELTPPVPDFVESSEDLTPVSPSTGTNGITEARDTNPVAPSSDQDLPSVPNRSTRVLADRYVLLNELGEGATSKVYRAHDRELQQDVAIKLLLFDKVGADYLPRFRQELTIARQLAHRHIVRVYDIGSTDAGEKFISMELLEGELLRAHMDGPMAPGRAIQFVRQACEGLGVAHERGIVHRDIKPENLFICRDGTLKVMDFGLARRPSSTTTRIGFLAGTPTYMSPEQINAFSSVTAASDLYSLGVVLFEMLTGQPPFDGPDSETILHAHMDLVPPRVRDFRPEVPVVLDDLVHLLLKKDPAKRIETCRDLVARLSAIAR